MRTLALVLLKISVNLWYLEETLERSEAFTSFTELAWMSEKWRQSSKFLESGSFDVCKNATASIIVMLGYLELDTEISDADMKTMKSNDCKGISISDRDTNSVLAIMWEKARFSYKDRWKFINPFI